MTTKKSNGQATPKMEVKKQAETTNTVQASNTTKEQPKPSYEELLKRLEQLETIKHKKPLSIDETIEFYEKKKAKINQLAELKQHKENLTKAKKNTKEALNNPDFDGTTYKLTFGTNSRYNSDSLFEISNQSIIEDCTGFLIMKVEAKIKLLEAEIQKDI